MGKHFVYDEARWAELAADPDFLPIRLLLTAPEAVVQRRGRLRTFAPDGSHFWLTYTEDGQYSLALSGIRVFKDPSLDAVRDRMLEILHSGKTVNQWLDDWMREDPEYARIRAMTDKLDAAYLTLKALEKDLDVIKKGLGS